MQIQVIWDLRHVVCRTAGSVANHRSEVILWSSKSGIHWLPGREDEGIVILRNLAAYQSTQRNVPEDLNLQTFVIFPSTVGVQTEIFVNKCRCHTGTSLEEETQTH
jgi:hypothetical protein